MKKIVVSFLPLVLIMAACSKNPSKITIQKQDSSAVSISKTDTIKQNHNQDRQVTGNTIIREVDAQKFPVKFEDEFTNEDQKLIIHLKNAGNMKITGKIISESGNQNIRFNNVELNDQSIDGPFGQDIEYNLNQKGNYSLIIGKSLMADGSQKGKFSVQLK
ncbi:hypothetical protein [Elizabethkingia miricola]|uniref:Lipoprotein n=1 Tax=Elizabethkingia miricola TaxID=172045 RepID=A0ABD5BAK5_ELIMR|nr:hypothetical protein [Elizabethkingia miricola]MDQ8750962.1 hypothetical protein [Elizabethkingia miricola]NHQ67472.1 hypothetical protein [Elizabethkingia miricola]NHQ69556.1 hypothetical protein [Elizabethkingia miricola]NHQ78042.1 hypothetical protein [Elizabethkingia miricola]OPB84541.1 hypothetical protein BAS06_20000 [Elizabethkingia miricola]